MKRIPGKLVYDFDLTADGEDGMYLRSSQLKDFSIYAQKHGISTSDILNLIRPALSIYLLQQGICEKTTLITLERPDEKPLPADSNWHNVNKLRCVITPN